MKKEARRLNLLFLIVGLTILCRVPSALAQGNPYSQLVEASKAEMAKKGGKLKMTLDWPAPDTKGVFPEFKKAFPFVKDIAYFRETGIGPFARYLLQIRQGQYPDYDIMHIAGEFQPQYEQEGVFVKPPFDYREVSNFLPADWPKPDPRTLDPKGYFLATTANARGNIWNPTFVPPGKEPTSWEACLDPTWKGKVLLDTRNRLHSLQHDPKTRDRHLRWLKGMLENGAVLTEGQIAIVQKVASGEFPIGCGVNYQSAFREIDRGAPLRFAFPDPIPLETGSRIYVVKWSQTPATTQLFALWLGSGGQDALEKSAYRGFPWHPTSRKYPMARGKYIAVCDPECTRKWDDYNREYAQILGLPGVK